MTEQTPIRIVIVDDHVIVRRGLKIFLRAYDDLDLVGEAASGYEALALCSQVQPDIVLMDLAMPDIDGPTTIRAILEKHPNIRVIALTSFGKEQQVQAALDAGAKDYLLKNVSADELAEVLRAVFVGP